MRHTWVKKTKIVSQCKVCGCLKEMRYSKVVSWKSYFVYIKNNREYSSAPECINPDDATGNLFSHE
jgi:hypothetical protein